jgi:hypothetical protein
VRFNLNFESIVVTDLRVRLAKFKVMATFDTVKALPLVNVS